MLAAVGVVFAVAQDESVRRVTSGRAPLAGLTLPVFLDHPVLGVGIGAQARVSSRLEEARARKIRNVSHTTPLTVAAELGLVGLAFYLALLAATVRALFQAMRREQAVALALLGDLHGARRPLAGLQRLLRRPVHLGDRGADRSLPVVGAPARAGAGAYASGGWRRFQRGERLMPRPAARHAAVRAA